MSEQFEQRWTDQLHLRRIVESDVRQIALLERDPAVNAHPDVPTEEESEATVRGYLAHWASDSLGYWAVERNGALVGVAGLRFMTFHLRDTWNLYYRFAPAVWGRGYALEAVEEALVVAQEQSARMPVVARTRPGNAPAFALAQRAGLTRRKDLDRDGLETHVTHW